MSVESFEPVPIQWFPGHMTKTRRLIEKNLSLVDAVVELLDARAPRSSQNPDLNKLVGSKPMITILNKADLADEALTGAWVRLLSREGRQVFAADCRSGRGLNLFVPQFQTALRARIERNENKGMGGMTLRAMVVGIPNSGKSSFINRIAKSRRTKVADRPGVTRGVQWVSVPQSHIELMDMPGVLWPKFEDPIVGERLSFTGAIKDERLDTESLALRLILTLHESYPGLIAARYAVDEDEPALDVLTAIAHKRGMIMRGREVDYLRAAVMLIDEFREGKLGRVTLDRPEEAL